MTEESFCRRHISRAHLEVLAQYMERYPALALASARSREGHVQARRAWDKIARTLNRIEEGVAKNGRSWARYWIDLKFKIRRKYMLMQRCNSEGKTRIVQLNPIEQRIVKVLTDEQGNLLPTASVYNQLRSYRTHYFKNGNTRIPSSKSERLVDTDPKIDDTGGTIDTTDTIDNTDTPDYLILPLDRTDPDTDIKPNIQRLKDPPRDPIQILLPEEKKSVEDLRRELVEFEIKRQKELYELELQQRREKHELELSILRIKKQIALKELGQI